MTIMTARQRALTAKLRSIPTANQTLAFIQDIEQHIFLASERGEFEVLVSIDTTGPVDVDTFRYAFQSAGFNVREDTLSTKWNAWISWRPDPGQAFIARGRVTPKGESAWSSLEASDGAPGASEAEDDSQGVNLTNHFLVGVQGPSVVILRPRSVLTPEHAINLAAYLVTMAEVHDVKARVKLVSTINKLQGDGPEK